MQIINVIEIIGGVLNTIVSFPIPTDADDQVGEVQAAKANELFLQLAKENGFEPDEDFTEEDLLDNSDFDDHNGYEVLIAWSHEIVSSIPDTKTNIIS